MPPQSQLAPVKYTTDLITDDERIASAVSSQATLRLGRRGEVHRNLAAPKAKDGPQSRPGAEADLCGYNVIDGTPTECSLKGHPTTQSDDDVIRSLSFALKAAERGDDHDCAEALRIAIAVRLQGLRSETLNADKLNESKRRQVSALQKWRLKRVVEYIENHLSAKITLSDLAAVARLSRMHFAYQFRVATGSRPHEFLLQQRIRRAEDLLKDTAIPIVEVALTVGFQTQAHFTTVFKRLVGCTPQRWRAINQIPTASDARNRRRIPADTSCDRAFE
jgi:AraC family transcriptional regulator